MSTGSGALTMCPAVRAYDPDQCGQDSDAKEDSTYNIVEYNRDMAHRNSARRSTAQPSARHINIKTFS
eukprot:8081569-Pyramimonas_sp.AAC.1